MKRRVSVSVSFPVSFIQKLEAVYNAPGPHSAVSFPDFLNLLIGFGIKEYRETLKLADDPEAGEDSPFVPTYLNPGIKRGGYER